MRLSIRGFSIVLLTWCAGCASSPSRPSPALGLNRDGSLRTAHWSYQGEPALQISSSHYVIYTTILDERLVDSLGQLMESALAEYQRFAPGLKTDTRPMECYLFASRGQWSRFTQDHTGADAPTYLHINRGGYAVGDWYVAYYIGDIGTFSVAAHEGFHQYAARHFKTRIPPFLEEGIACMFEDVRWDNGTPSWDLDYNGGRLTSLRTAVDDNALFSLAELCSTHAGQVVTGPRSRISAFYGQSWAFARFLWSGEDGRYRAAMQRMLTDAANGTLQGMGVSSHSGVTMWDPHSAKPLLEHYLGADLEYLDRRFRRYVRQLVDRAEEKDSGT